MSDLLELAVEAHGGRGRWGEIKHLIARTTIGGGLWPLKGVPGIFGGSTFTADAHRPHLVIDPVSDPGRRGVWEPQRVELLTAAGKLIEGRNAPRDAFDGHELKTPWSHLDAVYFGGYAMWNYLTMPFLFTRPGFQTEEIEPWTSEEGETWRRLKVTYPYDVPTHTKTQIFYFGPDGILRRQDYSVDIVGGANVCANCASEPRTFGGIVMPTRRRVYMIDADNKPIRTREQIAIDIHDLTVE